MAAFTLRYIKDYLQNKFYPYTHSDAVYTDDGENKTLTESLSEMNKKIEDAAIHPQSDWNETDNTTYSFIKNKPASLPANGGNADTVDGKHANEFVGNEHLTSLESHKSLFDEKLSIDTANPLIKNITFDSSTGIITITRLNNTTFTINIPKSLVFNSALFDDVTNEIVITWSDDSKSRIPVDGLIDVYTGSENDVIQITVNDENIISAVIKNGSVTRTLLSTDVQTDLSKAHIHSNESTINKFSEDSNGNVLFNGTSISTESGTTDYTDLTNKPQINNVELSGNKSLSDLGIEAIGSADAALSNAKAYTDSVASSKVGIEHLTNHIKPDGNTIIADSDGTLSTQYTKTTAIPANADLNDYKNNTGFFACYMTNTAMTLLNCPTPNAFFMIVGMHAGTYQEIIEYTNRPKRFMRNYYAQTGWSNWYQIYTTADPPPATDIIKNVTGITDSAEVSDSNVLASSAAVHQVFQSVSEGKRTIASAITGKGITTAADATFRVIADNIKNIVLPAGNATAAQVLAGRTFSNTSAAGITGTMANRGAVSTTLNAGGTYTIPAGYHNGSGKVTANSLASQTAATAVAANITSGKTAWINGAKITGTGGDNTANYNSGYNTGVAAADGRVNANSVNYQTGYNNGVVAADGRANANSVNYKTGYNTGYSAGQSSAKLRRFGYFTTTQYGNASSLSDQYANKSLFNLSSVSGYENLLFGNNAMAIVSGFRTGQANYYVAGFMDGDQINISSDISWNNFNNVNYPSNGRDTQFGWRLIRFWYNPKSGNLYAMSYQTVTVETVIIYTF